MTQTALRLLTAIEPLVTARVLPPALRLTRTVHMGLMTLLAVLRPHVLAATNLARRTAAAVLRTARAPGADGPPAHRTWTRTTVRTLVVAALLAPLAYGLPTGPSPTPASVAAASQRAEMPTSRSDQRPAITTTVTLTDGARTTTYAAPASATTLGAALSGTGVVLGELDQISPPPTTLLVLGTDNVATITRITSSVETVETTQEFTTRTVEDPKANVGVTRVVQAGQVGVTRTSYTVLRDAGGAEVSRDVHTAIQVSAPIEEVRSVGTRTAPAPASVPASAAVEPGTARAIALEKVLARGWDQNQFACLDALWTKESGWRTTADNPSSSAYGIPQALPGSKMASAGTDWATNPATQIEWGLGYIAGRYTTPCGAWDHSKAKGWY